MVFFFFFLFFLFDISHYFFFFGSTRLLFCERALVTFGLWLTFEQIFYLKASVDVFSRGVDLLFPLLVIS